MDFNLEIALNGINGAFLDLCLSRIVFFFNTIVVDGGNDEHIFNALCINLHPISCQLN